MVLNSFTENQELKPSVVIFRTKKIAMLERPFDASFRRARGCGRPYILLKTIYWFFDEELQKSKKKSGQLLSHPEGKISILPNSSCPLERGANVLTFKKKKKNLTKGFPI